MIREQKKAGHVPGFDIQLVLGGSKTCRVSKRGAGILDIAQGFANDLLGDTSAFTTLRGYASRVSHVPITAAAFIDGFTDLAVGNALAKTHVHMNYPLGLRWLRC